MTNKERREGNKLIVTFMGYLPNDYFKSTDYESGLPAAGWIQKADELSFTTSWDCLMPVIEKIESLKHPVYISSNSCVIYEKVGKNFGWVIDQYGKTKIEATWNAIVEFIKSNNKLKIN
jgi:hypothetical protein